MSELANLGALSAESGGKMLLAFSSALSGPHNRLLRYGPTPGRSDAEESPQTLSNFSGQSRLTSCSAKSSASEDGDTMIEETDRDALGAKTDNDLLARYQQLDDHAAYTELDRRYRRQLVCYASRFNGGSFRSEAEDIVQDALLTFHENRKSYLPRSVQAVLHGIVANDCKDRLRQTAREKRANWVARPLLESDADPKADPAKYETKSDLDEALGALTPEKAEAVRLMRIEGHTAESAAELIGVSAEAMRKRESRGIKALVKELTAPLLILLAVLGATISACNLDMGMNLCATEADADRIFRRNERHESNRLCRKSLVELPIRPGAAEVDASMTRVVNARHEDYDVLIARPSKWGNPFQIGRDGDRQRVIQMYEVHVRRRPDLLAALPELVGKRLGCYCKPEACHGDVLVKLLRGLFLDV